jgi:serine/threonine-protein kinase HipA
VITCPNGGVHHTPNKDLEELFKRIVFNICVKNTDDHLRNHGFLLTDQGWILSPAFDMNPVETGTGLKLNISETDNSLNLDLAMEVSGYFRLTEQQSTEIIVVVKNSIQNWRDVAAKYKIPKSEQDRMSNAFWPE